METNTGSSSLDHGGSDIDSGACVEDFVEHNLTEEKLQLTPLEYYKLMFFYEQRNVIKKDQEIVSKDIQIKQLQAKIYSLEATLQSAKLGSLKNKEQNFNKKLEKIRSEAATRLGIASLDPYMVDDETFELVHESDFQNKATETKVKEIMSV